MQINLMEFHMQVKRDDSNEAYVALTLQIGHNEENQPFTILVKMSANFSWKKSLKKS